MEQTQSLEEIQSFTGKYPKQLWYLFLVEMWERFCFYGMRGVLTIFMADKLLGLALSDKDANKSKGIHKGLYSTILKIGIFIR